MDMGDRIGLDWGGSGRRRDHERVAYGTDDPERQWLNIALADDAGPRPVCLYAHANGGSADVVSDATADAVLGAGYSLVSWHSVPRIQSPADVQMGQADAQLAFDWVRAQADTYDFDPDRIVICGRSRGSVVSWELGYSGHPSILGAYYYNALPDGVWTTPEVWNPLDSVDAEVPLFLAFGPAPNDGDIHNPANLHPVVDRYEEVDEADNVTLIEDMTVDGLEPFHFFGDFVGDLDDNSSRNPDSDTEPDDVDGGCSTLPNPAPVGWVLVVLFGLQRRRRVRR